MRGSSPGWETASQASSPGPSRRGTPRAVASCAAAAVWPSELHVVTKNLGEQFGERGRLDSDSGVSVTGAKARAIAAVVNIERNGFVTVVSALDHRPGVVDDDHLLVRGRKEANGVVR